MKKMKQVMIRYQIWFVLSFFISIFDLIFMWNIVNGVVLGRKNCRYIVSEFFKEVVDRENRDMELLVFDQECFVNVFVKVFL